MTAPEPKELAVADEDMWVEMSHSKIDADPVRVTRKAFENVWKDKGWKLSSSGTSTTSTKKES